MNTTQHKQELEQALGSLVEEIYVYDDIDSTNAEALRVNHASSANTMLLSAYSQSAGRGRLGRKWHSPKGAGLYLSLVKRFSHKLQGLQALSLVTALSVKDALQTLGAENLQLKWPNDLLAGKAKLGGILLESSIQKDRVAIVFGIGINLQLPESVKQEMDRAVTDLNALLTRPVDRLAITAEIMSKLIANIELFENHGFKQFQAQWNDSDRYLGQDVVIQSAVSPVDKERNVIGHCLGVDETGALVLRTASGIAKITGGEIFPSLRSIGAE